MFELIYNINILLELHKSKSSQLDEQQDNICKTYAREYYIHSCLATNKH